MDLCKTYLCLRDGHRRFVPSHWLSQEIRQGSSPSAYTLTSPIHRNIAILFRLSLRRKHCAAVYGHIIPITPANTIRRGLQRVQFSQLDHPSRNMQPSHVLLPKKQFRQELFPRKNNPKPLDSARATTKNQYSQLPSLKRALARSRRYARKLTLSRTRALVQMDLTQSALE